MSCRDRVWQEEGGGCKSRRGRFPSTARRHTQKISCHKIGPDREARGHRSVDYLRFLPLPNRKAVYQTRTLAAQRSMSARSQLLSYEIICTSTYYDLTYVLLYSTLKIRISHRLSKLSTSRQSHVTQCCNMVCSQHSVFYQLPHRSQECEASSRNVSTLSLTPKILVKA